MKRILLVGMVLWLSACAQRNSLETGNTPPTQKQATYPGSEAVGLAYSIVKTAADPQWLKDPAIVGLCSVSLSEGSNLETPCQNVTVTAVDRAGKEFAKASTDRGKFRLSVEIGKDYFLKVVAPLYKMKIGERMGPVRAGETVEFRVTKK